VWPSTSTRHANCWGRGRAGPAIGLHTLLFRRHSAEWVQCQCCGNVRRGAWPTGSARFPGFCGPPRDVRLSDVLKAPALHAGSGSGPPLNSLPAQIHARARERAVAGVAVVGPQWQWPGACLNYLLVAYIARVYDKLIIIIVYWPS
jgi:hypothetical protein